MALCKPAHVISTVKRRGVASATAKVTGKRNAPTKAAAKASRKAAQAPIKAHATTKRRAKQLEMAVYTPKIERQEPHIRKMDDGKPLVDRLNPKLLEQLRTRKVTNTAAAAALGISETYLSRTLSELQVEKIKGETSAHREARAKLNTARRTTRELLAKKVNRQEMTVEKAAKEANCSVRTMFRYCAQYANLKRA